MKTPTFERYIGIDYSGAKTPEASLKGLRVYAADPTSEPVEIAPPPSPRKYWSRREVALWLVHELSVGPRSLIGIDHAFSFPLRYFEVHMLEPDWPKFLDDFCRHWPTDEDYTYVDFVRDGSAGRGERRRGNSKWRRLTDIRAGAKSVFHFDVPGSVAKSTHAGLPWLRYIRQRVGEPPHFWPFDGWDIPDGRSAVVEVYPSLWSKGFAREGRTPDQHDAYSIAEWLRRTDRDGELVKYLHPTLDWHDEGAAQVEGWILGLM